MDELVQCARLLRSFFAVAPGFDPRRALALTLARGFLSPPGEHGRRRFSIGAIAIVVLTVGGRAFAQDEPPRIGPFVVDVRVTVPNFVTDPELAKSRGLKESDLPGRGLGADAGVHVYVRWKAITFGIGGQLTLARSHGDAESSGGVDVRRAVTERFTSLVPQLSFNFGTGNGWSYLSGGIGTSTWAVVPDGQPHTPADDERLTTMNYGGGARWFSKAHLAFTFDVRLHAIYPGTPQLGFPGSPRTTMLIVGAGISLKP